ncbi:hypothetical protein [Pseudonocardia acaciae]|uniref:hypothetical protein n=1 Tax=Pseudonocardia acaciae TaxID=551276 RepID=UPI0012EE572C|nr:hypothetical protein [Pseudonocardia acaciae]
MRRPLQICRRAAIPLVCAASLVLSVPSVASASVPVESHPAALSAPVKPKDLYYHVVDEKEIEIPYQPPPGGYNIQINSTVTLEKAGNFMFYAEIYKGNDAVVEVANHPANDLAGTAGQVVKTGCTLYSYPSHPKDLINNCVVQWNGTQVFIPPQRVTLPWVDKMTYRILFWSDRE